MLKPLKTVPADSSKTGKLYASTSTRTQVGRKAWRPNIWTITEGASEMALIRVGQHFSTGVAPPRLARLLYFKLDFVFIFFEKKVCIGVPAKKVASDLAQRQGKRLALGMGRGTIRWDWECD